jgi:ABC-type multidrug transport system ATPase subunit
MILICCELITELKAYVTQDNVLMSTMSVREAVYYSAQLQLPDTMPVAEKRAHTDDVIREMGLGDAMDTRIGGRMTKGISGGQRKRLTICIEMLTRPRLLFLDEPTSGLDSAASYHVMTHIAKVAAREGMTVVAAVHQPSGDVFDLFHGLCLLSHGRTIFFGAASEANQVNTLHKPLWCRTHSTIELHDFPAENGRLIKKICCHTWSS